MVRSLHLKGGLGAVELLGFTGTTPGAVRPRSDRRRPGAGLAVVGACAVWAATLVGCGNGTEDGAEQGGDNDGPTATVESAYRVTTNAPWIERHGLTSAQFQSEFNAWKAAGYRMSYLNGYAFNGADYYNGIWESSSGPAWGVGIFMTLTNYQTNLTTFAKAGYYPVVVSGYTVNGGDYFAAIWEQATAGTIVEMHELTATTLPQQLKAHLNGYTVVHITGYGGSSGDKYAVIWKKTTGSPQVVVSAQTEAQFQQTFNTETAAGYHLTMLTAYPASAGIHVVGVFEKGTVVPWVAYGDMQAAGYQQALSDFRYQGFRPITVSGFNSGGIQEFSTLWQNHVMSQADLSSIDTYVSDVMNNTGTPSISLAVAKGGRLVFAKAYGYADTASGTPATTQSLYRIASISKGITATAILNLIDHNRIALTDTLFGTKVNPKTGTTRLPWLGASYPYNYPPCVTGRPCIEDITVKELLSHTSGGWSTDLGGQACNSNSDCFPGVPCQDDGSGTKKCFVDDPMFDSPGEDQLALINYGLNNIPVVAAPGSTYGYSNFGFCLLGRVIEKVTQTAPEQGYASWVQQNILGPVGVSDMQIEKVQPTYTYPQDQQNVQKWPNEVTYYSPGGDPYADDVHRMDSHGGWVATPIDLLRLTTHIDGFASPPDIISAQSYTNMTTPVLNGYGLGWVLEPYTSSPDPGCLGTHPCTAVKGTGALAGTITWSYSMEATPLASVIFTNSDAPGGYPGTTPNFPWNPYNLYQALFDFMSTVSAWPSYDLFNPPNLAVYDPPTPGGTKTQCTVGGVTMHCCPTGDVMIGADANNDVFKCAPVQTPGALSLDADPGTQRSNMHVCPYGQVMVGVSVPLNDLACMALPSGAITGERVDVGTLDAHPMHVCDAIPSSAMSGIRVDQNLLLCATDPQLD